MNRKQLIFLWCGIAAVVFCAFVTVVAPWRPNYALFSFWVFLIALVTGGMIYTFKDKKGPEDETRKPMNLKRGFNRLTYVLSLIILVAFTGGAIANFLDGYQEDAVEILIVGLVSSVVVWVIYGTTRLIIIPIIRWIAKGFEYIPDKSRDD